VSPRRTSRIHIERLDLDLRGVPRDLAESVARRVGPALTRALAEPLSSRHAAPAPVSARRNPDPQSLAEGVARQVAARIAMKKGAR
jgi:hypothetical protein